MNQSKAVWSWCLYDFANSAFITSVATFIFPLYFKSVLMPQDGLELMGFILEGKTTFPLLISLSLAFVFVLSPWLGAKADQSGTRKIYLISFCSLGSLSTMGLFFTQIGDFWWGSILFVGGMIGFSFGNVFYNSLLKDVSSKETLAKVSAHGWALGYAGGFTALVIHMFLIIMHTDLGITKGLATKIALGSTGLWWAIFAIPIIVNVKESPASSSDLKVSAKPWRGMLAAYREVRSIPILGAFLLCFFLYNDAVQTTISQATNLANELLGMQMTEVLQAGMMIQFVAIFGSLLFLWLEKKFSTRQAVLIALVNWIFILIWALIMQTSTEFYLLCAWVGLVLGVTQSGSRTLFARQIPEGKSAQLFSFYTLADRASAVFGPLLFAIFSLLFPMRYAVLPLILMLLVGTLWLRTLPLKRV